MQHEGSFHLDDIRHLQADGALRTVLNIKKLPQATTLGGWLRRVGSQPQIQAVWVKVNKAVLKSALQRCKKVTLALMPLKLLPTKRMHSGLATRTRALEAAQETLARSHYWRKAQPPKPPRMIPIG